MAAIAFDSLKCARRLKNAGFSDEQAEVQAEIMAEAFVFNMDALVTKDYLDARLDARFAEQSAKTDVKFAEMKDQFKLVYWMLAVVIATNVLPSLTSFWGYSALNGCRNTIVSTRSGPVEIISTGAPTTSSMVLM